MPQSEFYLLAQGKQKSTQEGAAAFSAGPASLPQSDFVELLWQNGQVVMQGQSSKPKKITTNDNLFDSSSQHNKIREKGMARTNYSEIGKLEMIDSILNDFHLPVSSGLDEHDGMAPWLSYQLDDQVPQNYNSDFFMEMSDVTANELPTHTTHHAPMERRSYGNRVAKDPHPVLFQNPAVPEQRNLFPARPNFTLLDPAPSIQSQSPIPSFRSRVSDANNNAAEKVTQSIVVGDQSSAYVYPNMKPQTEDQEHPLRSSTVMNFSHFSRPAALVKSSLDTMSAKGSPDGSFIERVGNKDRSLEPVDQTGVASISGRQNDVAFCSQPVVLSNADGSKLPMSKSKAILHPAESSRNMGSPDGLQNNVMQKQVMAPTVEKTLDPVVASSVCSGNSIDEASNDPTYSQKRRHYESEDTEYPSPSEDVEEESVGIKKAAANRLGSGSKRSRAAEVHNLSERRRRDRINEKMRALQDLIPNCNKVDKASMLDEAIEYLKTLQLQVQMMSMGPGLCMPPMMLPHAAHMPRFSPMGVGIGMGVGVGMGMGMGMGYGLGMLDMNGNASRYPLAQMPPVLPGARFQGPPVPPGLANLNGNPVSNHPAFGFQGQGVPMPMSRTPAIPLPATSPPVKPVMNLNTISSGLPGGNLDPAHQQASQSLKDPVLSVSLEETQKRNGNGLAEVIINQAKTNDRDQACKAVDPSNAAVLPVRATSEWK